LFFGIACKFVLYSLQSSDLGQAATVEDLEALSGKKRKAKLDAIKTECQSFIKGPLCDDLRAAVRELVSTARTPENAYRIELDGEDPDRQTLLFWYPTATAAAGEYVRSAVKIEGGAKSALDPNLPTTVRPYVNDDLGRLEGLPYGSQQDAVDRVGICRRR